MAKMFHVGVRAKMILDRKSFRDFSKSTNKIKDGLERIGGASDRAFRRVNENLRKNSRVFQRTGRDVDKLHGKMRTLFGGNYGNTYWSKASRDLNKGMGRITKGLGGGIATQIGREIRGIGRALPGGTSGPSLRNFIRGGVIGGILKKGILGPLDLLQAPARLTSFMRNYLPGLAVFVGLPVLMHQVLNAAGVVLAAMPPLMLTATAVMQKAAKDLSLTTGKAVNDLRTIAAFGGGPLFGGGDARKGILDFSDKFDQYASGNLPKLKNGKLSAEGERIRDSFQVFKDMTFGRGGESVFDAIKKAADESDRFGVVAQAVQQLINGQAVDSKGNKISADRGGKLARQIAKSFGNEGAVAMLRAVEIANYRNTSVSSVLEETKNDIGALTKESEMASTRIIHSIQSIFNVMTGTGIDFFNARGSAVAKWFEDLTQYFRDTRKERAKMMADLFDVNKDGIGKFFKFLAQPESFTDPDGNKVFKGLDGKLYGEDPRILGIRQFSDAMQTVIARAPAFLKTMGDIMGFVNRLAGSESGKGLDTFGEKASGALGGLFSGLLNAFEMPDTAKPSERIAAVLGEILRGAGVKVTDSEAFKKFGEIAGDFYANGANRLASVLEDTGNILQQGWDSVNAAAKNDRVLQSSVRLAKAFASSFQQVFSKSFELITGNDGLMALMGDLGQRLGQSLFEGMRQAMPGWLRWFFEKEKIDTSPKGPTDPLPPITPNAQDMLNQLVKNSDYKLLPPFSVPKDTRPFGIGASNVPGISVDNSTDAPQTGGGSSNFGAFSYLVSAGQTQQSAAQTNMEAAAIGKQNAQAMQGLPAAIVTAIQSANITANVSAPGMTVRPAPTGAQVPQQASSGGGG